MADIKEKERKIVLNANRKDNTSIKAKNKKSQSSYDSDKHQTCNKLITSGMAFTVKIY